DFHKRWVFRFSASSGNSRVVICHFSFLGSPRDLSGSQFAFSMDQARHRSFGAYCFRAVPLTVVPGVVAMKRNSRKSSPAVPKKLISSFQAGTVMVLLSTQTEWPSPTGMVVRL